MQRGGKGQAHQRVEAEVAERATPLRDRLGGAGARSAARRAWPGASRLPSRARLSRTADGRPRSDRARMSQSCRNGRAARAARRAPSRDACPCAAARARGGRARPGRTGPGSRPRRRWGRRRSATRSIRRPRSARSTRRRALSTSGSSGMSLAILAACVRIDSGNRLTEPLFPDLRAFLAELQRDADLVTVDAPVDARLEAAEIHRRVIAAGGRRSCSRTCGAPTFPLVTNLFGTARRAEMAFGRRPLRLIRRLVDLAETILPPTPGQAVGRAGRRARARCGSACARVRRGPVTEVVTARRAPRPPAGAHLLARGRRARSSRCRSSTPSIPTRKAATTSACTGCTSTTRAPPACTGRSARAAASTTPRPRRRAAAAGDGVPGRPARADPRRPSRRCPRTCPS